MDCLFCKIINGDIPSKKVYEDDKIFAFHDIDPQAPVHVLIVPKEHIQDTDHITAENAEIISEIFKKIPDIAKEFGLEKGYRVVSNTGEHGQQSVAHLHFHLIGGRQLQWPPG